MTGRKGKLMKVDVTLTLSTGMIIPGGSWVELLWVDFENETAVFSFNNKEHKCFPQALGFSY